MVLHPPIHLVPVMSLLKSRCFCGGGVGTPCRCGCTLWSVSDHRYFNAFFSPCDEALSSCAVCTAPKPFPSLCPSPATRPGRKSSAGCSVASGAVPCALILRHFQVGSKLSAVLLFTSIQGRAGVSLVCPLDFCTCKAAVLCKIPAQGTFGYHQWHKSLGKCQDPVALSP